ncbi:MAG: glycosyltransferase [Nanoarchaeota archaeon]
METKSDFCFEVSWEICNKVGGIYTVVSSKAGQMIEKYGQGYIGVGPFFPKKAWGNFEEKLPPEPMRPAFEEMKNRGITCHFGTWLIKGSPNVILLDFTGFTKNTNEIKKNYWDWYGIDSLGTSYFDFDEPMTWGYACGMLIERLHNAYPDKKMVAHFHEWLSGGGLLYLKHNKAAVGTIFTTHATMLGRTLASADIDLYAHLKEFNPDQEARNRGIICKHSTEKACANNADAFTTVSEITGIEAEHLLSKKPDVLTLNGLDMVKFPTFEEASVKHSYFKSRMKEFCMYYFFPYYQFDLDNTLFYFLAGRYEFHDKGIDIFVKALADVNRRMQSENNKRYIVAFIFVPGNVKNIKPELLESKTFYDDLMRSVDSAMPEVRTRLTSAFISKSDINKQTLFSEDQLQDTKRKVFKLLRQGKAPVTTHDLYDENTDIIVRTLIQEGLDNGPEDNVKVVFYPIYLSGADTLLNMTYYEAMHGCHLGVFPSFYEPWGYTPLEASALGVPSVTTDLAGFGRYVCKECTQGKTAGIFVMPRFGKPDSEVIKELTDQMYDYAMMPTHDRVQTKINARHIAEQCDWKNFIQHYVEAHNLACEKVYGK